MSIRIALSAVLVLAFLGTGAALAGTPGVAIISPVGYVASAIWLLSELRRVETAEFPPRIGLAIVAFLIGAPAFGLIEVAAENNSPTIYWAGLAVIGIIWSLALEVSMPEPRVQPPSDFARYVPPAILLGLAVGIAMLAVRTPTEVWWWTALISLSPPIYFAASTWWWLRASRPARFSWWRLVVIGLPILPPVLAVLYGVSTAGDDDIPLGSVTVYAVHAAVGVAVSVAAIVRHLLASEALARAPGDEPHQIGLVGR